MAPLTEQEREQMIARAWERFRRRRAASASVPAGWLRRPIGWAAVTALLLVGALGFSPAARSATVEVLSLFRVTQIAALPLDDSANAPLRNRSTAEMLQRLIADQLEVTRNERPRWAADAAQASALAGFSLRYAAHWDGARDGQAGPPRFRVLGAKAMRMTVDRARAQSVLDDAGVVGVRLPPSLDGAVVSVQVPRALAVLYGDCSAWAAQSERGAPGPPQNPACTVLGEGPSPLVRLPPGLDMRKIADVGLQLLGWTPEQAAQYTQTVDWTSTLVVPFPRSQAQSRPVSVDGVQGILFTRERPGEGSHYVLLWSREGMLYSIEGSGDGTQGLNLAGQMGP